MAKKIDIAGELESKTTEGKLADASQIKDSSRENKSQKNINDEFQNEIQENSADIQRLYRSTGIDEYSEYSELTDYIIGDVVLYDGVLFRFKADHAAGEWDYNKVEEWSEKKEREAKLSELGSKVGLVEEKSMKLNSTTGTALVYNYDFSVDKEYVFLATTEVQHGGIINVYKENTADLITNLTIGVPKSVVIKEDISSVRFVSQISQYIESGVVTCSIALAKNHEHRIEANEKEINNNKEKIVNIEKELEVNSTNIEKNRIKNICDSIAISGDTSNIDELFRIGNLAISNEGWIYGNGTKRVNTKEGVTITLLEGDVVSLTDYTDARFFIGFKNRLGQYKYSGWYTSDFRVVEDGEYVINIARINEVDLNDKNELLDLLNIKVSGVLYGLHRADSIDLTVIPSYSKPNVNTTDKVLDLGDDTVLIIGKKHYPLKIIIENADSYRKIPYYIEGYESGAIKIVFNISTKEFYPKKYLDELNFEEVVIAGVRLEWGLNYTFKSMNAPFLYTIDERDAEKDIKELRDKVTDISGANILPSIELYRGHCNGENGSINNSTTRIISRNKLELHGIYTIDGTKVQGTKLKFYIVEFDKKTGAFVKWSGWYSPLSIVEYEFLEDYLYVIEFGFVDDSVIYTENIKDVVIYKKVQIKETSQSNVRTCLEFVAHRGFHLNGVPENSLDAYRYAARCGFKYAETDFCPTLDGELVIMHDDSINRTMRNKSDYSDISEVVNVHEHTLSDLRGNYVLKASDIRMRRPIPTLEEFLRTCRNSNIYPILEIKGNHFNNELLSKSFELGKRICGEGNFGYCSFYNNHLDYIRSLSEDTILLYINSGIIGTTNTITNKSRETKSTWWYPSWIESEYGINLDSIRAHKEKGIKVFAWVPPVSEFNNMLSIEVDGIAGDTISPNINNLSGININSDVGFSDFMTDGSVENYILKLSSGQSVSFHSSIIWLGGYYLSVIGKGEFTITAPNLSVSIIGEQSDRYIYQGLINNKVAEFVLSASSDTEIEFIEFKVVKF